MDWAEKRSWERIPGERQYARQTALVFESGLSVATGLALAAFLGGVEGLRGCFSIDRFLIFLPVAMCFALGLSMKMMAVNHFQAGTIKIFGQLRLPLIAVMSAVLLGRRYSAVKWQAIGLITISCLTFVVLKGQGRAQQGKEQKWKGLLQVFSWVILNVLGGIFAERGYKDRSAPYAIQKVSQDFGHLLVGLVMLLVVVPRANPDENIFDRGKRPGGFFDSWDIRTVSVVFFLLLDAWIGNLLLKEFSAVTRSITKAFGVSAVYFCSLTYAKERKSNFALSLVAIMVIQSSLLYSFIN